MATLSTIAVDFIANIAKYTQGLETMTKQTKTWSGGTKKDTQGAVDSFNGVSKALEDMAKKLVAALAVEKIGEAFVKAAKDVSMLADEAEKVGASAEQFVALDRATKKFGSNITDVKVAYKELQKSVNEALAGNKETVQSFKDLGVSYNYIANLSPDKKFLAIADALSKVGDENKRAEIGVKLLGKAYTELAPLIAKGSFGINAAGVGGLSEKDIQTIDKVTKAFENVGKTIDDQFKKALVDLAPALMAIAEVAKVISMNWMAVSGIFISLNSTVGTFVSKVSSMIAPLFLLIGESLLTFSNNFVQTIGFYTLKFYTSTNSMAKAFVIFMDVLISQITLGVAGIGVLQTAITTFGALASGILTRVTALVAGLSAAFSTFGAGVVIIGGTLAASFMAGLVAMEGLMNGIANGLELFNKDSEMAKEFRATADAYQKTREDIVAKIAGIDQSGNSPEIIAQRMHIAQYKIEQDARKTGEALDAEAEKINKLKEEGKKLLEELTTFSQGATKDAMTSYEKADDQFNKLTQSLDLGLITLQTYDRQMAKLIKTLDTIDLAKLRAVYGTGPFDVLGKYDTNRITDQTRFMKRGIIAENFGTGTILGGKLPKELENLKSPYQELQDSLKSTGTTLLENGRTAQEVYDVQVKAINVAVEAYKIQGREEDALRLKTLAMAEAAKTLKDANVDAFIKTHQWMNMAADAANSFADGIANIVANGGSLKDVFNNVIKQIEMMIIKTTILQGIMSLIGIISPTSGAAAAFGKMTGLTPRASGGPVSSNTPYLVGENGPEMFIPKNGGYVVPNGITGGGSSVTVVQNISVETGVSQTVRAEMSSLLPRFKQEAMAGVIDAKSRGGSYGRALAA